MTFFIGFYCTFLRTKVGSDANHASFQKEKTFGNLECHFVMEDLAKKIAKVKVDPFCKLHLPSWT